MKTKKQRQSEALSRWSARRSLLVGKLSQLPPKDSDTDVIRPEPRNIATQTKPEDIPVSIDRDGNVYWRGGKVDDRAKLLELMVEQAGVVVAEIWRLEAKGVR